MSLWRRNKTQEQFDIWPGFVDALSTVLLVFIFVLVGFISSQMYLSGVIFDKDSRLTKVCSLLSVEKNKTLNLTSKNKKLWQRIFELNESISILQSMLCKQEELLQHEQGEKRTLEQKIEEINNSLKEALKQLTEKSILFEQVKKENIKLSDLSKLSLYRSEFFDRLQNIVKDKKGIKISGDRFIFQSELFFDTASDDLSEDGKKQVSELADVIKEIGEKIPSKIKWILRVDGHTDKRPIASGGKFKSNWELSAARAISVVRHLIKEGISPEHLVAAGFGENQPVSKETSEEAFAKNRRIEFKLDER
jgi:chemotaxis protein MotB